MQFHVECSTHSFCHRKRSLLFEYLASTPWTLLPIEVLTYTSIPATPQPIPTPSPKRCGVSSWPSSSKTDFHHHHHPKYHHRLFLSKPFGLLESPLFRGHPNDSLQTKLEGHHEFFLAHSSSISFHLRHFGLSTTSVNIESYVVSFFP